MTGKFVMITSGEGCYFKELAADGTPVWTNDFCAAFKCFGPKDTFNKVEVLAAVIEGLPIWHDFGSGDPAVQPPTGDPAQQRTAPLSAVTRMSLG